MKFRAAILASVVGAGLVATAPVSAQHDAALGAFADESFRIPLAPSSTTIVTDVEMNDYDRDGDLDLFIAKGDLAGGPRLAQILRNNGSGVFSVLNLTKAQADHTDVELGNVNGDARVDLVLSTNLGVERLFVGVTSAKSGGISFQQRPMPPGQPADVTIESQLFDADGDGDQDIITANEDPFVPAGAQNRLYLNDGTGVFTDRTTNLPAILDDSSAFAIADFDVDGDRDVITVNDGPFIHLVNDGAASFTRVNDLPELLRTMDSGRDAVVDDLDLDGDLDVMFAISRADSGPVLWLNDGTGSFADASATNVPLGVNGAQDLESCDIDSDGDTDVIEANAGRVLDPPQDHRFVGAQDRLLINDGGTFTDVTATHLPPVLDASFSIACGDINGDGLRDLVVANGKGESMRVYVQQPPGP